MSTTMMARRSKAFRRSLFELKKLAQHAVMTIQMTEGPKIWRLEPKSKQIIVARASSTLERS
jgi:hypothetical protein